MSFHPFIREHDGWQVLQREPAFTSPHLVVNHLTAATPTRPDGVPWLEGQRKAGAVVVPRLADGRYLLIRQERLPILDTLWEFPAGQIDIPSGSREALEELAVATALRELHEETGYQTAPGTRLRSLGHFFSSPGFMDELSFLFLAPEVIPAAVPGQPDQGEAILEVRPFTPGELSALIAQGEIRDANTLCAYARLTAQNDWAPSGPSGPSPHL